MHLLSSQNGRVHTPIPRKGVMFDEHCSRQQTTSPHLCLLVDRSPAKPAVTAAALLLLAVSDVDY